MESEGDPLALGSDSTDATHDAGYDPCYDCSCTACPCWIGVRYHPEKGLSASLAQEVA